MPRHAPVLAASLLAVLVVLLLDFAGIFVAADERVIDMQQRQFPRDTGPYDDNIVLVDIDDGSIDRLGRWPWPRSTIADAINELRLAGARTIALDIEFSDPQIPTCDPETGLIRDEDAALVESLDESTVLATVLASDELEKRWAESGGSEAALDQIVQALQNDITATPEHPPVALALNQQDQSAFETNHLLVKRRAIQRLIAGENPPSDLEELQTRLVPSRDLHEVAYPERPLLEAAWNQHQGLEEARLLLANVDDSMAGSPSDRVPLQSLLQRAGGLGYVNITHRGPDGAVRSIYPARVIRGGHVLSLGLAAVVHYLGLPAHAVVLTDDMVQVGDTSLPLSEGRIWLNWPRSEMGSRWRDLHRRTAEDKDYRGHLSVSEIVEIGRARRRLETQREVLAGDSRDLVRVFRQDDTAQAEDWLSPTIQQEIQDEVDFNLEGVSINAKPADFAMGEDEETLDLLEAMQRWRRRVQAIDQDQARFDLATKTLTEQVDGAMVFVGWTSTGAAADFIATVAGPRTPGVLVHATLADMVLQDRGFQVASSWVGPTTVLLLGLLVAIFVTALGPWWATTLSLMSILVYVGLAGVVALAVGNVLLPLVAPILAGLGAWACGTGVQAALAQRDKRRITRQFRARVSDQLVDALIADPGAVSMSGVNREMAVLFADLAGFTRLSESLGSEQIVRILNTYLSALTSQLVEHGAYVNKFLGDGVMAFWSAFQEEPAQAQQSCAAAMACQEALDRLNKQARGEHPPIGLRVGIATGPAVVGDCGAPPDLNDYTVIGDTVNLASRLESANKQFGTKVLVNHGTYQDLAGASIRCRCVGRIQVVGRETAVQAWEIVAPDCPQEVIDLSAALAEAIAGDNQAAAAKTLEALRAMPGQETFVNRWAEMVDGPAESFGGPLRLVEK